jgi:serine/threonine protein kinase
MSSNNNLMSLIKIKMSANTARQILKTTNLKIQGNALNSGKYGAVFNSNQKNYIVKIGKINSNNENSLISEAEISEIASNLGIGPKVPVKPKIITHNGNDYVVIKMEKMDGTLLSLINSRNINDELKISLLQDAQDLLRILHKQNICHRDLHLKNIMYKKKNDKYIIKIIDFGQSYQQCSSSNILNNKLKLTSIINNLKRKQLRTRKPLRTIQPSHNSNYVPMPPQRMKLF